jgi:hypothetical protein
MSNLETSNRLIKGSILRCVDGKWTDTAGIAPPERLVALGTTQALQCWSGGKPTDTVMASPGKPLPSADELNSQIPEDEWEKGLDGKPRAPWVLQHVAYLVDPVSCEAYTFINGTFGAKIAVERLAERVATMQRLRGGAALPVVKLESRPMKTKFGTKLRPEFAIVEWREFADQPEVKAIEHKPKADDAKAARPGKPVAPLTLSEELNDELPSFA